MPDFIGAYNKYSVSAQRHIDAALEFVTGRNVVVQAGGHSGQFPVYLSSKFEYVYTWEPVAPNFMELIYNIGVAGVSDKVFASRGMLGDVSGTGLMSVVSGSSRHQHGEVGAYPIYRIDDLRLPVCDMVYLDVEDDELHVLRGTVETIQRCRPVIAAEERAKNGDIGKYLRQFGYVKVGEFCNDLIFKIRG